MTPPQVIYICSSGRSGSTLLNMMLGSHPELFCVGEIEQLPKNVALNTACSCGATASDCPFWTQVFAVIRTRHGVDIAARPYDFELGLPLAWRVKDPDYQTGAYRLKRKFLLGVKAADYLLGLRVAPSWVMRGYEQRLTNTFKLFAAVADVAGRRGLVDSSKQYGRAVSLYQRAPEQVKILLLVRDGRAVFNAALRHGMDRPTSLKFWKTYNERAFRALERNVGPSRRQMLQYEQLVADPAVTLHQVCRFLGIGFDPAMLDFRSGEKHLLSGNDMRMDDQRSIELDEKWKHQLSAAEYQYFVRHGGEALNAALGYR